MPQRKKVHSIANFKENLDSFNEESEIVLRKQFIADVEKAPNEEEPRTLKFTISTESEDRDQDIIRSGGWDLKNFKKNPVVLWAHSYFTPPIGRSLKTEIDREAKVLRSIAQFTDHDENPFGFMIYRLFERGYMKATSVGFIPKQWEKREDVERTGFFPPMEFIKQELLEFSAVPVPANPEALLDAKSNGVELSPMVDWIEHELDEYKDTPSDAWVSPKRLESIWRKLVSSKSVTMPDTSLAGTVPVAGGEMTLNGFSVSVKDAGGQAASLIIQFFLPSLR